MIAKIKLNCSICHGTGKMGNHYYSVGKGKLHYHTYRCYESKIEGRGPVTCYPYTETCTACSGIGFHEYTGEVLELNSPIETK